MTAGTISPWPLVRKGDQQHPVKTLQYLLRAHGHNLIVDGIFGPNTDAAVRAFQQQHGLAVDGIAGPQTLAALGISAETSSAPSDDAATILERIAECESGGDPTAVSADGRYYGKYQFSRATWRDLGGSGDPAAAPEAVQDAMAAKLLAQRGTTPWPVCG